MNIQELSTRSPNLNQSLDPDVWSADESLNAAVRNQLSVIAEQFIQDIGIRAVEDVRLTGSTAGFAYAPGSTLVLHVVAPVADDEIYQELIEDKITEWQLANQHSLNGYPVTVSLVDSQISDRFGCYSLTENAWKQVPRRRSAAPDDLAVASLIESWSSRIRVQDYLQYRDDWQQLKSVAVAGSVENVVVQHLAESVASGNRQSLRQLEPAIVSRDFRYGYQEAVMEVDLTPGGVGPTTRMFLNEKPAVKKADVVREFFRLCVKALQIENPPRVQLRRDPAWSARNKTFGRYDPAANTMELSLADRNVMDICRTLAHELVHCRQNERGELGPDSGRDGSPQENEANSLAGAIMRKWGKQHPEFFAAENIAEASGYIPTKSEAHDPRWEMALTADVRPGATGREANKLSLVTDSQGHPQIARADGKIEHELAEALRLFKDTVDESLDQIPDWLIDLYDRAARAEHAGGRGASPGAKRSAAFANKALVKGIRRQWGEDGARAHGYDLAMAHKAKYGYDSIEDYLDGEQLDESANQDRLWQAKVQIKQKNYNNYITTSISAPDYRTARILIANQYGIKDNQIAWCKEVKRK